MLNLFCVVLFGFLSCLSAWNHHLSLMAMNILFGLLNALFVATRLDFKW